ncbi:hypothetical protein E2C01_056118 [Portunus trituberculatus]|uniref:Uncharacterized protein n=1 Tax=Portunus trituberculatus TaxID=210409 RepID=A0A5B7GYS0_PORTR|nr:hypothetical protein [Portunus trituberculatus]
MPDLATLHYENHNATELEWREGRREGKREGGGRRAGACVPGGCDGKEPENVYLKHAWRRCSEVVVVVVVVTHWWGEVKVMWWWRGRLTTVLMRGGGGGGRGGRGGGAVRCGGGGAGPGGWPWGRHGLVAAVAPRPVPCLPPVAATAAAITTATTTITKHMIWVAFSFTFPADEVQLAMATVNDTEMGGQPGGRTDIPGSPDREMPSSNS